MLFHFVAFPYMHYSQSYGTSNTKGCDFEKWVEYQGHAYVRDKKTVLQFMLESYIFFFFSHKSWLSNLMQGLHCMVEVRKN